MERWFPGSRLVLGQEQTVGCAGPHFGLVSSVCGRLDHIETIRRWRKRFAARGFRSPLLKLALVRRWLTSAD